MGGKALPAIQSGTILRDRYRVRRLIGESAMSEVYLAEHTRHAAKLFAIKVLKGDLVAQPGFVERLRQEAEVLERLNHPFIVRVYEVFDFHERSCIVLAFVDGESLAVRIRREGALPFAVALALFESVLEALDFAHRAGVIHRDLKPSNILIDSAGAPHLCDFGIAKQMGQRGLTLPGAIIGTPQYMSPEQITSPQSIDHRSDIYSAGIVLYEMLTGKVPFGEDVTASDFSVLQQQVQEELPDPRNFVPDLDGELVCILQKALSKAPTGRFQGGLDFKHALERYWQGACELNGVADNKIQIPNQGLQGASAIAENGGSFAVYEHPTKGLLAIKRGFSWSAFFFGPLWLLRHGLYSHTLVTGLASFALAILLFLMALGFTSEWHRLFFVLLFLSGWGSLPAWLGSKWRERRCLRQGYILTAQITALTSDAALAAHIRSKR